MTAPEPRDPQTPVDFAPVRIGRRRTGPDPMVIGVVVVVIGIVAAIVKPWDLATTTSSPGPAAAVASASPAASGTVSATPASDLDDPAVARAMLAALGPHESWGVRALLDGSARAGRPDFVEHWQPVVPSSEPTIAPLVVERQGPVRAIGISAPLDEWPLAIRVWREEPGQAWRWLDVRRPPSIEPAAELLLTPPRIDGEPAKAWPEGRYRIDLLMGATIARVDVTVGAPLYAEPPVPLDGVAPGMAWLGNVPAGPFAVVGGVVVPLVGRPGDLMTPAEAWLDVGAAVASTGESPTVLGVLLPAGAHFKRPGPPYALFSDPRAVIRRLAPDPDFDGPVAAVGVRFDGANDPTPYVTFTMPEGTVFPPGTYAVETAWTARDGAHEAAWHVELRPGPELARTPMGTAARRYAPFAGRDALVLSGISPVDLDPAAVPVRVFPLAERIGCDGTSIAETPAVIGIAHPAGEAPERVDAAMVGSAGRAQGLRLRLVREVVAGLSLVAPADGPRFDTGTYRFSITGAGSDERVVTLCIGGAPAGG